MNRSVPIPVVLLLTLAAASSAWARDTRPATPAPAHAAAVTAAPVAAPVSLLPASVPALTPAEENMISRSDAGLTPIWLPFGGVQLDLQGRFQEFATITVAPGGQLVFRCVDDADVLRRILFGPPEPAPVVLEDR